jgi:branched-chain amino acid transport system substrate-binding protein
LPRRRETVRFTMGGRVRRQRILALAPVLPLLLAAGACTSSNDTSTSANKTDIVIAASLELTGAQAETGKVYENALRLKVEQINAGRTADQPKVALRISDNRSDPGTATAQLGEIATDPTVTAIITGASSECLVAAAKTLNDKGMPTISLAPASEVSTPLADRKYIFKLAPNANHDADTLITSLAGVKTIRFIASKDAYGSDALTFMTTAAKKANLDVGAPSELAAGANPADIAATVAGEKPDAVVVLAWPSTATATVQALRTAGYKGRIALDAMAAGPLFLTGGDAQDGESLVFTQTLAIDDVIATTPAKAAQKQWFEDYTARYGAYQAQSSFAADAAQIIVDSVDRTGSSTDHNALRATFETVRTDGLTGPIRLSPSDHSGLMPQALTLLTARNGRWRLS